VPATLSFDYAVLRVVPRVEREEFVNAGVVLHAPTAGFLGCRIALDAARLHAIAPGADVAEIEEHLEALQRVCAGDPDAGPVARLGRAERFHWLTAPRSTVVQVSPVHSGLADDPAAALAHLFDAHVR
jgi:DUF3037 family protein